MKYAVYIYEECKIQHFSIIDIPKHIKYHHCCLRFGSVIVVSTSLQSESESALQLCLQWQVRSNGLMSELNYNTVLGFHLISYNRGKYFSLQILYNAGPLQQKICLVWPIL